MSNYHDLMIANRRQLHKTPELGWGEFCTTAFVIESLRKVGLTVLCGKDVISEKDVMGRNPTFVAESEEYARSQGVSQLLLDEMQGYTGCVGIFNTGREGPVVGLRFDIDCVGVEETSNENHLPNKLDFRSRRKGLMHSCGHDGHTSVGIAMAQWLMDHKEQLNGTVKLFFQPAEEGVRGGAAMASSGLFDDVDYLLGAHLAMMCKTGEVCTTPTGLLCTTKFDIRFEGAPAHPTMSPHLGRNALAAACNAVDQLLGMMRHGDGLGCVNVGLMSAGECRNVIPVHAELKIEVRGETAKINQYMVDQALRIIKGTALSYDVKYDIEKVGEAGELINDPELVEIVTAAANDEPTCNTVIPFKKIGCSEDYTMMSMKVQEHGGKAIFFVVGSDRAAAHHQAEFDIDETGLDTAFGIFTGAVKRLCSH